MTSEALMNQLRDPAAREEALRRIKEFRGLDGGAFMLLAANSYPELHRQGEILWKKGDDADSFLVVVEGNLMPRLASVATVQANQTVGLLPFWAVLPEDETTPQRTGDILVTSQSAVVLRIGYEDFGPHMSLVAKDMAHLFARHLAETDEALAYI